MVSSNGAHDELFQAAVFNGSHRTAVGAGRMLESCWWTLLYYLNTIGFISTRLIHKADWQTGRSWGCHLGFHGIL